MENDLISRAKTIETLKKTYCTGCDSYNGVRCRACWVDDAETVIDSAPSVEAEPKWISVKERLPETCAETRSFYHSVTVLASENGRIMMGYFTTSKDDGSFDFSGVDSHKKFYDFAKPSHWMPLPKPPEEEE